MDSSVTENPAPVTGRTMVVEHPRLGAIKIWFGYDDRPGTPDAFKGRMSATEEPTGGRETVCDLLEFDPSKKLEEMTSIGAGVASCHPNDNFNKRLGRKIAFERALAAAQLDREDRRFFWDALWRWVKK